MQNKNNIKNWKIEITNEGAKLFITEGAVMARDVLNLAREQAIKYNLSNIINDKIVTQIKKQICIFMCLLLFFSNIYGIILMYFY